MLTCKCLNIVINTTNPDIQILDSTHLQLSEFDQNDIFFQQELGHVTLDSISKEQPSLVCSRYVGDWIVHQCWNCGLFTHALQKDKGASTVLVNLKLLSNDNEINALRKSDQFSNAFRIVINNNIKELNNSSSLSQLTDLSPRISTENLALGSLQQKLNEAVRLKNQEIELEIRKFTEKQYNLLDDFREQARQEHRILCRLVLAKQTELISNNDGIGTPHDDQLDNTKSIQASNMHNNMTESSPMPISLNRHINKPKNNVVNSLSSKLKRESSSRILSSKLSNSLRNDSYDSEAMFDLDGIDDCMARNHSEISDCESDDSQNGFDEHVPVRQRTLSNSLAKSLPVNVPTFMSPYTRNAIDIDEDQLELVTPQMPENPLDIAASIKALAKSINGDGVFGDLPRPRFSSQI